MYMRAAHHLEITCGPYQSENGTLGQSGDETNRYGRSSLGRYWVQSIKGCLRPCGLVSTSVCRTAGDTELHW